MHVEDRRGTPVPGAAVMARLSHMERYAGNPVRQTASGVTDNSGVCCLDLFPNELGSRDSQYLFAARLDEVEGFRVLATVPNRDCALHELVSVPAVEAVRPPAVSPLPGTDTPETAPAPPPINADVAAVMRHSNSAIFRIRTALDLALKRVAHIDPDVLKRIEDYYNARFEEFRQLIESGQMGGNVNSDELKALTDRAEAAALQAASSASEAGDHARTSSGNVVQAKNYAVIAEGQADRAEQAANKAENARADTAALLLAVKQLIEGFDGQGGAVAGKPLRKVWVQQDALPEGSEVIVPEYKPGSGNLFLYRNGLLLQPDRDYTEQSANAVAMLDAVPGKSVWCAIVIRSQQWRKVWTQQGDLPASSEVTVPAYQPGTGKLFLYRNGLLLQPGIDYEEKDSTTVVVLDPVRDQTVWCALSVAELEFSHEALTLAMYLFNDMDEDIIFVSDDGSVVIDEADIMVHVG